MLKICEKEEILKVTTEKRHHVQKSKDKNYLRLLV